MHLGYAPAAYLPVCPPSSPKHLIGESQGGKRSRNVQRAASNHQRSAVVVGGCRMQRFGGQRLLGASALLSLNFCPGSGTSIWTSLGFGGQKSTIITLVACFGESANTGVIVIT
jgi:hypothetical protein